MLRAAVFALALAGLALLAGGILDAAPLVFWSTREELATIEHGRTAMLAGAALTLAGAAAFAALRERAAAALLLLAALLPTALVLVEPSTALGLLALVPALGAGFAGAVVAGTRPQDRQRLIPGAVLGMLSLAAAVASGVVWGALVAAGLLLAAYMHARAGGREPRAAAESLLPGAGFAALTAVAVFAGGTLAG